MTTRGRRLIGGLVCAAGVTLVVVFLPLMLTIAGAALFQDGVFAMAFVLAAGLVPVGIGAGLAHLGRPGFWRRSVTAADVWRMPGVAGVALALVTLPLIFVAGRVAVFVVLAALCLYPFLEVPRVLARPSWWRAAAVSVLVWIAVFAGLVQAVDVLYRLGDDTMIFLVPFLLYPLVLVVSGLTKLGARVSGQTPKASSRVAILAGGAACLLVVGVPIITSMVPVAIEKITGNTVGRTVYAEEAHVLSASPGQVSVHLASGATDTVIVRPDAKFDFRGPGSSQVKGVADASWLKAGQRIGLEYAFRAHKREASLVTIWLERKGCAENAKWTAAAAGAATPDSLAGTTWESRRHSQGADAAAESTTFEFLAAGALAYQDKGGSRYTNAAWRQAGPAVLIELSDCYAEYEGQVRGDAIEGVFSNEVGLHEAWTARRTPAALTSSSAVR
jgi:hypothetical protein